MMVVRKKPGMVRAAAGAAGLAMLLAVSPATAGAGQIYQWTDANGIVHFSDNPDDVPVQDRDNSRREVQPLAGIAPQEDTSSTGDDDGRKVWESKCQACHVYDSNSTEKGHTGLLKYILNPETKFPYPDDQIKNSLENGIRGNGEGMPAVDISEDELNALVAFLKKEVSTP
jgi:mono/diheme cytochrome c family protein